MAGGASLLNVAYKLFAKVLQLVLMEIISFDQCAFFPLRFILDNILLTHKMLEWAAYSKHPLIFLKLEFLKAYDMVDWGFLFSTMAKLGIPLEFIDMTKLLFHDATPSVKVNGVLCAPFGITRGCDKGSLVPYLFQLIAEVLNSMVKKGVEEGCVKGICLPMEGRQQVIGQYADDTSFTLLREEESTCELLYILETFCLGSGLTLNWRKSCGYWQDSSSRPSWTDHLGVTWVEEGDVSKLLGTSFGLALTVREVNEFLHDIIDKKLEYWSTAETNIIRRGVIVNSVLLSSILCQWQPCLGHFTSARCQTKRGSKVWNQVGSAWRGMVSDRDAVSPRLPEEIRSESLWWSPTLPFIGPSFSKLRASRLHGVGLKFIKDARIGTRFLTVAEAKTTYGL